MTLRRLARLTSAAISERSAATVESRSSQKTTWLPLNFFCSLVKLHQFRETRKILVPRLAPNRLDALRRETERIACGDADRTVADVERKNSLLHAFFSRCASI